MYKKICRKFHIKQAHVFIGCIFLITMFFACSPLMTENCINGHDIDYHLLRIESLKTGILMGKPFLRVNALFFGGMGYASSMFYPDFLLYIPAAFRVMGIGINASYHLFIVICIALVFFSFYYCTKKITHSRYAAVIAGSAAILSQYFLDNIYVRSAVGEFTAFIFIPFVLYSLYDLLYEDLKSPWMLWVGFTGVMLCHTLSLFLCVLLFAGMCLLNMRKLFRFPILIGKLACTAIAVLAVTSFYWLPMLEQMSAATFHVSQGWVSLKEGVKEVSAVFYNAMPAMGMSVMILLLVRLGIKKNNVNKMQLAFSNWMLFIIIVLLLGSTRLFPWERAEAYLGFIQFPWRLYLLATACVAITVSIYFENYFSKIKIREYALFLALGIMLIGAVMTLQRNEEGYYSYSDDYYTYAPYTANVIGGEWLPEAVTQKEILVDTSKMMYTENGQEHDFERVKNTIVFMNEQNIGSYADVPLIYYKGYEAYLQTEKVKIWLEVTGAGENGRCRVALPKKAGQVTVYYAGTLLQKLADILSVLTIIGLLVYYLWYKKRKKLHK